tara:strand:- start:437 stop:631 length:195 start_codon:yes stop_codon:yes gene_type:complete
LIEDKLKSDFHNHKDDIITLLLALQKQNFVLGNSLTNLVQRWTEIQDDAVVFGLQNYILLERPD